MKGGKAGRKRKGGTNDAGKHGKGRVGGARNERDQRPENRPPKKGSRKKPNYGGMPSQED